MDWSIGGKDKRRLLYLRNVSGIPTVIFRKNNISPKTTHAGLKGSPHPFNIGNPAFRSKNTFVYLLDVDNGQVNLDSAKLSVVPELTDATFKKQIAKQLVSSMDTVPFFGSIMFVILSIGFGVALGYILGLGLPIG